MKVHVIGVGMGNPETLTVGALRAIEESGLLVGAARLLEQFAHLPSEKHALVRAEDIVAALAGASCAQASVLMSGDVGFYSGATALCDKLSQAGIEPHIVPGVSSLAYFCAKLRMPWQDVTVVSAHGREHNAAGAVQANARVFCLTGGANKVQDICAQLVKRGLGGVRVFVGERLSYADERLLTGTAAQLAGEQFADLSVMLVENPCPIPARFAAPSLEDAAFERGSVPMTKSETRALVMAKLRIRPDHVVWDIGAGTGSVSVEAAFAAREGRVFSIEKNPQAIALLEKNKAVHGVMNMQVVQGEAPAALAGLPAPDRVFVGGSGGKLEALFEHVLSANAHARICATAVTLETLTGLLECIERFGFARKDIVQAGFARAQQAGRYHLMRAENPVFLVTVEGACL